MDFKIGDRVIYIDNDDKYNILKQYMQYIIVGINNNYTETYVYLKDHSSNLLFNINRFKLDKKYYRKEKLKQLRNDI
jgi:hypothetical protein